MTGLDRAAELKRLCSGDGFEALVAYCRQQGAGSDAEDRAQDACVIAHRKLAEFEGRSGLRSWLYGIAKRLCLAATRQRETLPLVEALERADSRTGVVTKLGRHEAARRLDELRRELPQEDQELLVLRFDRGLTPKEMVPVLLDLGRSTTEAKISHRVDKILRELEKALGSDSLVKVLL
jgi:RNA polymerase sigma factor (sigma-70 family)